MVVLEFLLTSCPHCQRCSAIMQKLSGEFGQANVQMLGVAVNEGAQTLIDEYSRNLKLTFPIGHAPRAASLAFLQHPIMKSMLMPQLVLIDKQGVVRFHHPGEDKDFYSNEEANMRSEISQLIKASKAQ